MTRILGLADLHIGASHLTTLDEQEAALQEVVRIAERERVELVLIGGDATHHAQPSTRALDVIGRFFDALASRKIVVVMAAGNHDPNVPAVARHFRGNIHIALTPPDAPIRLAGVDVAVLPYLPDASVRATLGGNATKEEIANALTGIASEYLRGYLAQRRAGVPLVLVAHGTLRGSVTSSDWSMGFIPGTEWQISVQDAAEFDFADVGHLHRHQSLATNVVVPGSLLPLDFAETDPHGVVVADVEAGHTTWRFVPLESTPTVATLDWDDRELERVMTGPMIFTPGDIADKLRVRLRIREDTARRFPVPSVVAQLQRAGAQYVQVGLEVVHGERARDASVTAAITPLDALRRYLESDAYQKDEPANVEALNRGQEAIEALETSSRGTAGGDLELRAIDVRDFLGVHAAHVDFDGHGVYALTGPVGAGKSTIGADAVRFALTGASRYGAKVTDLLVRQGADLASASVDLAAADGRNYRIVRKLKRTSRGVTSTLDVLGLGTVESRSGIERELDYVDQWMPLSSGKVADGQKVVDEILGGLTDETLVASSIVVQRAADAFTRARAEDRKRLLAEAAGLHVYDELAEISRKRLNDADRDLARQHAIAEPLRPRAAGIASIEASIASAKADVEHAAEAVRTAESKRDTVQTALDEAKANLAKHDNAAARINGFAQQLREIDLEIGEWQRKHKVAQQILEDRTKYEGAKAALAQVRQQIILLEGDQERERVQQEAHDNKTEQVAQLRFNLDRQRALRERGRDAVSNQIESAQRQEQRLKASQCPVIDQISTGALAACTFLRDARADVAHLDEFARVLAIYSEPDEFETSLINEIADITIPPAPTTAGETRQNLRLARARVTQIESDVQVGEKIARAEEVVREYGEAMPRLNDRHAAAEREQATARASLAAYQAALSEVTRLGEQRTIAGGFVLQAERLRGEIEKRIAYDEGRLSEAQKAKAELAEIETAIAAGAADVAAWKQLVDAWRACRVLVLESSVIPAVEATANEILRRFPYGMQLAFTTQREKKSGEGVSEALDIEILGGRAPVYEGCSGGQKTTIDFALHVAVALVVSRRSTTRLRFLFADEPEGLDEPGRASFAAIARWIHETFGLTVLVASHAGDLVDALGGRRIDVVAGPDGSTVVAA
jgi:exonuclease SbcD